MRREIITTADGSKTIQIKDWNEQYHSKHGAIQEAYHVFIKHGLQKFNQREITLLEVGFGTGLNALITLIEAPKLALQVAYTGVEAYPITTEEHLQLGYIKTLDAEDHRDRFDQMHETEWATKVSLSRDFSLVETSV